MSIRFGLKTRCDSLALGFTCSRRSMMSLLTPTKSVVDHKKTSLFLLAHLHTNAHGSVEDSRLQEDFLELALSFDSFLVLTRASDLR
jgi:hypothetical protein